MASLQMILHQPTVITDTSHYKNQVAKHHKNAMSLNMSPLRSVNSLQRANPTIQEPPQLCITKSVRPHGDKVVEESFTPMSYLSPVAEELELRLLVTLLELPREVIMSLSIWNRHICILKSDLSWRWVLISTSIMARTISPRAISQGRRCTHAPQSEYRGSGSDLD